MIISIDKANPSFIRVHNSLKLCHLTYKCDLDCIFTMTRYGSYVNERRLALPSFWPSGRWPADQKLSTYRLWWNKLWRACPAAAAAAAAAALALAEEVVAVEGAWPLRPGGVDAISATWWWPWCSGAAGPWPLRPWCATWWCCW